VLDGVAFAFRDCLEALKVAGTRVERLTAVGGGSRSELWLTIIATVLGVPVDVPADGDFGGAFGAARLGLIAATGTSYKSVCTPPRTAKTIKPDQRSRAAYEAQYARYVQIYPAIKEINRQ
jgi:xylulokinase